MPKQYSLYLSTDTPSSRFRGQAPTHVNVSASGNSATWSINWDALFGIYRTGTMRVKYQFQTNSTGTDTYEATNGTLRVIKGLSSNTQMIYNGLILGMFRSSTGVLPSTDSYLYGDTTSSGGVECNIPKGFSDLTIALVNGSEVQITQTDNFQIMLFFELDNEIEKLGEN